MPRAAPVSPMSGFGRKQLIPRRGCFLNGRRHPAHGGEAGVADNVKIIDNKLNYYIL